MYVKISCRNSNVQIQDTIADSMVLYTSDRLHRILIIMSDLSDELKTSTNLRLSFEIAMAKICRPKGDLTLESLAERVSDLELVATAGDISRGAANLNNEAKDHSENFSNAVENEPKHASPIPQVSEPSEEKTDNIDKILDDAKKEDKVDDDLFEEEDIKVENIASSDDTSQIKMPERPKAYDFSHTRDAIREEANVPAPSSAAGNLNNPEELQKM